MVNEKTGEFLHRYYLRFHENREAKAPDLILKDMSFKFIPYLFRTYGYTISTTVEKVITEDGGKRVILIQDYKKSNPIIQRAYKKYKALMMKSNLSLISFSDVSHFFNAYIRPYLNENEGFSVICGNEKDFTTRYMRVFNANDVAHIKKMDDIKKDYLLKKKLKT